MTEQALRVRAAGPAAAALPAAAPPLLPGAPAQPLLLRRGLRGRPSARAASGAGQAVMGMRTPSLNAQVAPTAVDKKGGRLFRQSVRRALLAHLRCDDHLCADHDVHRRTSPST